MYSNISNPDKSLVENITFKIFAELLDNLRPVSPKPGHVERVRTPSCTQASSTDIDEESAVFRERFLKINVRHITDGQGVVGGVLLVTPNAVMFDPNVSDPLVIEHGPESYGVIAPMEFVVNAAIYNDIAHMRVGHIETSTGEKPEIYYPKSDKNQDSLLVKDETFPELGKLGLDVICARGTWNKGRCGLFVPRPACGWFDVVYVSVARVRIPAVVCSDW